MRRRKSNIAKTGIIFIFLLVSLSSISVSYSAWFDTISITGTVTTGEWLCEETAWARMVDDPDNTTYDFPGSNWATYVMHQPTCDMETFYFYAGQHYRAGELHVWKDTNNLYVEYDLDNGVTMSESHLHIATSLDDFPKEGTNPPPGQFDYKKDHDPNADGHLYIIPWDDNWSDLDLYIGAHAVVWGNFGEDCLPCNFDCE